MSLSTPQRTDIKRIIDALGRQAMELQQQRGVLIRLIQADPSYMMHIHRVPNEVRCVLDPDSSGHQYNHLIHRVQRIESSLARIMEKTTELHLLIPPIESLPPEVLELVFQAGSLSEPKTGCLPFPILIASVSRRWRQIALSTPTLWTNLHISLHHPRHWVSYAIERSADRLLDITLDLRTELPPSSASVLACMSLVYPYRDRWRRFTLISHYRNVVLIVGEVLADAYSQSLQHLQLSLTGSGPAGNQEVSIPRLLDGGAPALSSVRSDSVSLPWRKPLLFGLSTLDIRWLWSRRLIYPQFQDLLAASPALTRLTLRGKHVDLRPHEEYVPIYLPNLRFLELSGDNVCLMSSLLITPALETLTLANVDEGEFREFMTGLSASIPRYSTLRSLVLLNVATCPLSRDFVAAFSTITQLVIINSGAERFLDLLRISQQGNGVNAEALVWPRLRDVTMLDQTNYDTLYAMVAERAAHGLPLQRLIVHAEFIHRYMFTPLTQYVKIDSVTYLDRDP